MTQWRACGHAVCSPLGTPSPTSGIPFLGRGHGRVASLWSRARCELGRAPRKRESGGAICQERLVLRPRSAPHQGSPRAAQGRRARLRVRALQLGARLARQDPPLAHPPIRPFRVTTFRTHSLRVPWYGWLDPLPLPLTPLSPRPSPGANSHSTGPAPARLTRELLLRRSPKSGPLTPR